MNYRSGIVKINADVIEGFSKMVLAKNFDDYKKTPQCHKEWWDLCTSEEPLVAICAPRGHAKSTAITHCYTLACMLFKERKFAIIVSDTYEQAVLFLQDIKKELVQNEDLINLFKISALEKDAENDIIVRFADNTRFRLIAKGAEQKMRGIKWDGQRPDLIVCDDLENDEIVLNQERREKFRKWFFNALLPSRSDRGIVRVVGTILHLDSLLERLMPKDWDRRKVAKGEIVVEPLRAYMTPKHRTTGWLSYRYKAHDEDFSNILWPEKWPKGRLKSERQKYIDAGIPEGYAQEYLNYPIDDTVSFFRREDFIGYKEEDLVGRALKHYIAVDLAVSEKTRADFSVFVVGALDDAGNLYIRDVIRDRMDAKQIVDTLFLLNRRYSPEMFTIEGSLIEKSLGPFINDEMFRRQIFFNVHTENPTKDKETRARGIQARMRAKGVYFNRAAEWYSDLEQEMRQFPKGRHDDQVDAIAWLGLTLDKMVAAPSVSEIREAEEERAFEESGLYMLDICEETGY